MKKLQFPLAHDSDGVYPPNSDVVPCTACGIKEVDTQGDRVFIQGGGVLLGSEEDGFQPAIRTESLVGHLHMDWGSGPTLEKEKYAEMEIVDDVKRGQFTIYFCSTHCLRSFLNSCVDNLETEIEQAKETTND